MGKLTIIIVFVMLTALTVTSCQESKKTEVEPQTESSDKVIPKISPSSVDLSPWQEAKIDWKQSEGTHLSVLAAGHGSFPAIQPLLPIFEKLTGVQVGYQMLDETDMRTKRQVDLSSQGGVYDVFPIGVTYMGEAYANKWLVDLRPMIEDTTLTDRQWYDLDDIGAVFRELVTKDKHLLAIPYSHASSVFFYRKDLFKKYQIEIPDTYDDVISMKEKLHDALQKDGVKDVYSFATRAKIGAGRNTWTVIPCIRSYGGAIFDANWQAICNSPKAVEALKTYRDMITGPGTPPDSESFGIYDMRNMFVQGKLASLIVGSDFFSQINSPEKSNIWDKWDAALPPRGTHSRETSPWAWGLGINNASENKTAAWLFIQWVTSRETIKMMKTNACPARISAWDSQSFKELQTPGLLQSVKWSLLNATPSRLQTGIAEFPQAGYVISVAFSEIFHGAPVQQSLDGAAKKLDAIMKEGPTLKGGE